MNFVLRIDCRHSSVVKLWSWILLSVLLVLSVGCSPGDPDPDESGTIGTGILFRGTVSELNQVVSRQVQIRAQSGERSTATIASDGQYVADSVAGIGPWVLRSDLGNGRYRYAIAYATGIANVHSYTDVVIRSWFLQEHGVSDLNTAFDADDAMPAFPTVDQFSDQAQRYLELVGLVLTDYNLDGIQLFNDEFRTDDTGIDRFLDLNPVIVDGRQATFVKTDPRNSTQTSFTVDILLGAESEQADTQPPSMPTSLRALSGGLGEFFLVWEPSTDNTAVVAYEIFRNGQFLTETPYPFFADFDVIPDTPLTYQVSAIDLAGNRSAEAVVTTAGMFVIGDTTPPQAPRALMSVLALTQRVELTWLQDDVSDVAGFNVYRGPALSDEELPLLIRVSSTSVTDATVSSGREYCYQIASVDASGNESERTEVLCVLTTGIAIEEPETASLDIQPLAGLTVPDTQNVSCNAVFPSYRVNSELSVPSGCYRVEQNITVDNLGVLTLQPGVILKFAPDTQLLVETRGALVSAGTSTDPIVMTGERPIFGWWRGVIFNRSNSVQNVISHTVIEYMGSDPNIGGITLQSSTNAPSQLRVENSLIRFGEWYGISIPGLDSRLESFSGNLITQNKRAAFLNFTALSSITDGSAFIDNEQNRLFIPRGNYTEDVVINDPGLPLEINGINQLRNTLIINEGVQLYFVDASALIARGNIAIRGTAENPVLLSSKSPVAGSWQGMLLIEGANAQISHALIENAGQASAANPDGANLFANTARLSLENVTLRSSSSYGFHATGDMVVVDQFDRVLIVDNARPDIVSPDAL